MVHYPFLGQNRRDPTQAPREKGDPLDPRASCGGEERSSGRECGGRQGVMVTALKKKHSKICMEYYFPYKKVGNSILFKNNICIHLCIQLYNYTRYAKKKTNYLLLVCNINFCLVVHSLNLVIFNFMNWIREKIRFHNIIIDSQSSSPLLSPGVWGMHL